MNLVKLYRELILHAKALNRSKKNGYFENHHICPKCEGGTDDPTNLVCLTAREHFIAHKILWRLNPYNPKLRYAFMKMSEPHSLRVTSRMYELKQSKLKRREWSKRLNER